MSNFFRLSGVVLFLCLLATADGLAQQNFSRYNWYFGNTTRGIRFIRPTGQPSLVNNKVIPFSTGGSAVASNPINGDLLFYTDGSRIFDMTHAPMFSGPALLPTPITTNQPVVISARPGNPNQYYVFTNDASYTTGGSVEVTTVNMNLRGNAIGSEPPIGEVTTANVAIPGLTNRSEAMIVIPDNTGTNFWLVTHENGQDNFTVTLVDGSGDFSSVGKVTTYPNVTGFPMSAANFSYHAATGKLAVSPQTDNRNVAVLNFDNATGTITLDRLVLTSAVSGTTNSQAIYDTEWSPSGRFLYISVHGDVSVTADVLQFDMAAPAPPPITSLTSVLSTPIHRSYGLLLAPDTAIYHLYQAVSGGPFLLGRITDLDVDPDLTDPPVQYSPDALGGAINFNGRQFPEFLPESDNNLTVDFTTLGTCSGSPTSFFPTVTPAADSLVWNFGDGTPLSSEWSPVHTYQFNGGSPDPEIFSVTVTAYLSGQTATMVKNVSITQFDLGLTLVQDTTACRCEFPPPVGASCNDGPFNVTVKDNGSNPDYLWSNGDTGAKLTPDSAGYYYVLATLGGCTAHAGVNIREYDATDQRANVWYFGQNAGIDFNQQPPVALPKSGNDPPPIVSPEGVSVISDRNGQVIFSTDGVHVFDRNDDPILDATNTPVEIGGENGSTQSALIVPVQGDETLYYIFTTQQVHGSNTYELKYSLYDIKLRPPAGPNNFTNGEGGLVVYNQLLFSRSTERITSDGQWLIAHEYGNNAFRAYPVTANGLGNPVISSIGSDHLTTEQLQGQGYMKVSGGLLAVAFSTSLTNNALEIFDFVDSTGVVTNYRTINLNTNATPGQVYGVEIVGNKILTTIKNTPSSYLREVYMDFQDNPVLIPPAAPASGAYTGELGAIQIGPNGTLYVAVNGSNSLATINLNADTLQLSTLTLNSFPLRGGTQSRLGLPNFIQQIFNGTPDPSMTITSLCGGAPTVFQGIGTDPIDRFLWTFGDGFTADAANVEHTYPTPAPGTTQNYNVTLRIFNRCGLDTLLTRTITISGPPPNPTFLPPGQQPVVCNGPLTLQALAADDPDFSYLWSTGETTFTIQVDRQQIIGLTITNEAGCTSNRELLIADNRPVIDLGPDQTVCENASVPSFNAGDPTLVYQWEIDGVVQPTTGPVQPVNTSSPLTNPDADLYRVTGTNTGNGCVAQDEVTITIYQAPDINVTPTNASGCGATDGELQISINGPSPASFAYEVFRAPGTLIASNIDQETPPVPLNISLTGLAAGTYTTNVEDQVSGCAATRTVGINNTTVSIISALARTPTCTAVPIDVTASIASGTYRVINSATGVVVDANSFSSATFSTAAVAVPGDYVVEISTPGLPPCIATANVPVVSGPQPDIEFVYDVCAPTSMTIGITTPAPPGSVYTWSGSAGANVTPNNAPNTTANPVDGLQTFTLTITNPTDPSQCTVTESIEIFIVRNITATITQTPPDGCTDPVTISVETTPEGTYTYNWTRTPPGGGAPVPFIGGQSIVAELADHGATYSVQAVNTVTGCLSPAVSHVAQVFGEVVILLTTYSPCEGEVFSIEATDIPGATYAWSLKTYERGAVKTPLPGTTSTLTGLTQEGRYYVTATNGTCESEEIFGDIRFIEDPAGTLPSKMYICNRPDNPECSEPEPNECVLQLEAGDGISWQWSRAVDENSTPVLLVGETRRTLTVTSPGVYYVEILNNFLCINTDKTHVIERCKPLIDVPNAFRPGSSIDLNKTFSIFPTFVAAEGFQVFIYNRWGEMVYQSNNRDFKWDGTYRGNKSDLLPTGTYTYVIKYRGELTSGGEEELRGGVMLLR